MSNYRPHPGERCRITVDATYRVTGPGHDRNAFEILRSEGRGVQVIDSDLAVAVEPLPEPALPAAFGSLIVATVEMAGGTSRMRLVRVVEGNATCPWRAENGSMYGDGHMSDVEVPDAAKPVAGASALEPMALSLGALRAAEAALIGDSSEHGPLSKCGAERLGRKVVAAIEAAMNTAVDLP